MRGVSRDDENEVEEEEDSRILQDYVEDIKK
jgi:hypothetical protein